MIKKFFITLIISLFSNTLVKAFDASPFNTQSAELSQGGWWTLYYESIHDNKSDTVHAPFVEFRYTFFDKLRLGILSSLTYADYNNKASAFGFSNLILTTEIETYDYEKNSFLEYGDIEFIDHAAWFFNQFLPTSHNSLIDDPNYKFNTGIEFQKTLTKYLGFYSELGYRFTPVTGEVIDHSFIYNNSISFEFHDWFQPYIELLGLTSMNNGYSSLLLAPGISLDYKDKYFFYINPLIGLTSSSPDWGFQVGITGNL